MADISTYSIEELEKYLGAKKTMAAVEGKPVKTTVKPGKTETVKPAKKRKPMSKAARKALSDAAKARWKAAKKAGKSKL
jgi:hypothetical protein